MSQKVPVVSRPPPSERRTFLRGAAAGLAATSGLEAILASRQAPAFAQGTEVHLLQWVDFIPEGDAELRRQVAEYSAQTKIKVTLETINANDLQARITAAIQSGSGPDVIMMLHNWPHLYAGVSPTSPSSASGRPRIRAATTRTPRPRPRAASGGWPCPTPPEAA